MFIKRYVISTIPLKAATISWWGKRRWQIEGWFKTAKHRFGLDKFGQCTLLGIYRWLILSVTAYLLAHWTYLAQYYPHTLDWGQAAFLALSTFFPILLQDSPESLKAPEKQERSSVFRALDRG